MNKNYIEIHDNQEILNLEIHAVGKRENKNFTLRTVPALNFKNGVCRIKCVLQTAIDIQRIVESQQGFICNLGHDWHCLLYTSPSPRDRTRSRMPSSA